MAIYIQMDTEQIKRKFYSLVLTNCCSNYWQTMRDAELRLASYKLLSYASLTAPQWSIKGEQEAINYNYGRFY